MKKNIIGVLIAVFGMLLSATPALAHVTIKPGEAGVGQRLNFVVSVPTEEEVPTVMVRLVIPEGVTSVRPNVKVGWNIQLKKVGEGDEARVTEVIWSGGRIPAEQRDEFVFSAMAPAEAATIVWKAYQTYGDGDVVAWENSPEVIAEYTKNNPPKEGGAMSDDHNAPRPYSTTKVVNDLATLASPAPSTGANGGSKALSYVALALSALALGIQFAKKSQ